MKSPFNLFPLVMLMLLSACQQQEQPQIQEETHRLVWHTLQADLPGDGTPQTRTVLDASDDTKILWGQRESISIFTGDGSNMTQPNIFCMAENDMSQCQAMLSKARANNYSRISLLTRDGKKDDYAASFQQYYAYMAREMDMTVEATYMFENKAEMEQGLNQALEVQRISPTPGVLFFVPSSRQDILDFDEIVGRNERFDEIKVVCTDMAYDFSLEGKLNNYNYEGTALAARPCEGFDIAWRTRFGDDLPGGYAQLYDCFYLLAMAVAAVEAKDAESVREAIISLTSSDKALYTAGLPQE